MSTSKPTSPIHAQVTPAVSMAKTDTQDVKLQAARLKQFLKSPDAAAIRIGECCIQVS
jgi:hypothetical protein